MPSASVSTSANSSSSTANSVSESHSQTYQDPVVYNQYLDQYKNYLNFHGDNYKNIINSYLGAPATATTPASEGILGTVGRISQQIKGGYDSLGQQVQSQLRGTETANREAIAAQYKAASGAADQNLISSGLGNTTVRSAAQRGLTLDEAKAQTANSNQVSQLMAGYQAQIGQGGLQEQQQALNNIASLGGQYMSTLGGQRLADPTWAPNKNYTDSVANSNSASAAQGSSASSNAALPDLFAGPPPAGLNAGGSILYGPGSATQAAQAGIRTNLRVPSGSPATGAAGYTNFGGDVERITGIVGPAGIGNYGSITYLKSGVAYFTNPVTGQKANVGSTAGGSGIQQIGGLTYVNGVHVVGSGALAQGTSYAASTYAGAVTQANINRSPSPYSGYNPAFYNALNYSNVRTGFGPTTYGGGFGSALG